MLIVALSEKELRNIQGGDWTDYVYELGRFIGRILARNFKY